MDVAKMLKRSSFERVALVLQGGGALGAYQAGVYQAMVEQNFAIDWIAGTSIGAINGSIIAGNAPGNQVSRLKEFWDMVSETGFWGLPGDSDTVQGGRSFLSVLQSIAIGRPGFLPLAGWILH